MTTAAAAAGSATSTAGTAQLGGRGEAPRLRRGRARPFGARSRARETWQDCRRSCGTAVSTAAASRLPLRRDQAWAEEQKLTASDGVRSLSGARFRFPETWLSSGSGATTTEVFPAQASSTASTGQLVEEGEAACASDGAADELLRGPFRFNFQGVAVVGGLRITTNGYSSGCGLRLPLEQVRASGGGGEAAFAADGAGRGPSGARSRSRATWWCGRGSERCGTGMLSGSAYVSLSPSKFLSGLYGQRVRQRRQRRGRISGRTLAVRLLSTHRNTQALLACDERDRQRRRWIGGFPRGIRTVAHPTAQGVRVQRRPRQRRRRVVDSRDDPGCRGPRGQLRDLAGSQSRRRTGQ